MFCERGSPHHAIGRCYLRTNRRLGDLSLGKKKSFYNTIPLMAHIAQTWWQQAAAECVIRQRAKYVVMMPFCRWSEVVGDDRIG
jgi:hypothetical protein